MRMKRHNSVQQSPDTEGLPSVTPTLSNDLYLVAFREHRPPNPGLHSRPIEIELDQIGLFGRIHCHTAQPNSNSAQSDQAGRNGRRAHLGAVSIGKEEVLTATSLAKVADAPTQQLRLRS